MYCLILSDLFKSCIKCCVQFLEFCPQLNYKQLFCTKALKSLLMRSTFQILISKRVPEAHPLILTECYLKSFVAFYSEENWTLSNTVHLLERVRAQEIKSKVNKTLSISLRYIYRFVYLGSLVVVYYFIILRRSNILTIYIRALIV